ncbi:aldehyde dehydrogenase family protein [Neorhizobium sp. NCHU2750]|uniref:aldehyde dehydrogenase family protein n=1 Tax=Neorhizobium sp. NCHU2750 TaxID=1825976 RepID=UPI000EB6E692|nr:aldehyde dehydrogenase [Neorhizobium sp. NCHU2750]
MKTDDFQNGAMSSGSDTKLVFGGKSVVGTSTLPVYDKFSRHVVRQVHLPSPAQVRDAIDALQESYEDDLLTPFERGEILFKAAGLIEERAEEFVEALRVEAGFPVSDARGEISRTVETLRLSAEEARRLAGDIVPVMGAPGQKGRFGFTLRVPLGIVAAITPFNAPLNTVAHKVGPAIAAGNAVLLKPSLHTPTPSNLLAEVLVKAGLPGRRIAVLHGGGDLVKLIAEDQRIRFFAFTGSTEVGAIIQQYAGLRRTQMELGSIAFTYVADDADIDKALPKIVNAAYRKAGQVCTSVQMLLVHRSRMTEVEKKLTPLVSAMAHGDPADPKTRVGPVISPEAAERIEAWVEQAVRGGARKLVGGKRQGPLVPATLLADVPEDSPVGCKEVFGPVMSLVPVASLDEALKRINGTPYGLAAGIFTNRLGDAMRAVRQAEVGNIFINEASSARVDVMPYGGSKDSGFGREGPRSAIAEMTEERMVSFTTD